ncbi:hypothetical protein STENM327S_06581 [Streptomyces tendae]
MAGEKAVAVPSAWMSWSGRYRRVLAPACDVALALVVLLAAERYDAEYDLVLGVLTAGCLLARRRFPGAVMAAVLALALAQFVLDGMSTAYGITRPMSRGLRPA